MSGKAKMRVVNQLSMKTAVEEMGRKEGGGFGRGGTAVSGGRAANQQQRQQRMGCLPWGPRHAPTKMAVVADSCFT